MPSMAFDFDGLIGLLARNLYSDKGVFVRELVQNAHDSIVRRRTADGDAGLGRVDIICDPAALVMQVADDGEGMGRTDLERYLSVVGSSGTRARKADTSGMIGQFGIGFLSAFLVAGQVEVLTRKRGENEGWRWINQGTQDYRLEPAAVGVPGTTVTVRLRSAADAGEIHPDRVRGLVRKYADLLDVPVFVNGDGPVNRRRPPWEDDDEARARWITASFGEPPMEVIPVNLGEPPVCGLLYVSRVRMLESNRRCPLRIHCQRMFLHEDDIRLLPDWAFFIGGLIDSPALTPTAARDNFVDDAEAARIKTALGAAIVEHLLGLAASAPERLAAIVHRHDFGIKAACRNTQDLLPCLWDLLHWRVNDGRGTDPAQRRLPEILAQIPQDGDGVRDLPIFTQRDIGNPYFAMANAAGLTVIDASRGLDEDVLVRWAKGRRDVRLTRLDRDDSALVRRLDDADAAGFQPLAEATRRLLANHVDMPVTVEVRRFEPASLPVLFRIAAGNEGRARAEAVLGDSTAPADMREMAKSLLSLASQEASHFILNAANPLVRKLAHADIGDGDVAHVLIALFEGALLGGQEILTAEAASHFRQGFHHLLERHLHLADAARGYEPPVTPLASIWPRRHVVH